MERNKHRQLLADAIRAVEALEGDTTVPAVVTIESLEEIESLVAVMLEALRDKVDD